MRLYTATLGWAGCDFACWLHVEATVGYGRFWRRLVSPLGFSCLAFGFLRLTWQAAGEGMKKLVLDGLGQEPTRYFSLVDESKYR